MRVKLKLPYIIYTLLMLCNLIFVHNISALSYQGTANIGFTFNPTLSLSVSGDLIIPSLTPGSSADSNSITVSVATNTAYGYSITANVGNNTTHNNRNLSPLDINNSSNFTSLDYGSNIVDKTSFNDNTWGYSYSLNNGTTWKPYSGLPLYSDTTHSTVLFNTYSSAYSTSLDFKIAAKSSTTQAFGEYTNIINFYAVSVPEPPLLYDVVQNMTKGTLADNNVKLSDTITQANSGVYTYNPAVYGTASDASNDYPIYFYRGILDTTEGLGTYGSDGQADAWPNYVKLSNGTCWRIVRTTGSGGVKMIYNGLYGATTAGSCTNATGNTRITQRGLVNDYFEYPQIVRAGYTYNSDFAVNEAISAPIGTVFGNSLEYSTNNTNSPIKNFIENTWFTNNMNGYERLLESSAGYCNDRTVYSGSPYVLQPEDTEITTYGTSDMTPYYFGAYVRNSPYNGPRKLTLNCPRGTVDLYTTSSANDGNKQLSKPVALLTADEVSLTGSGAGLYGSSQNNINSYLNAGTGFWLLSPESRIASGALTYLIISSGSYLGGYQVNYGGSVRPVISLMHHIQVTGGNGTATSPWTIE